MTLKDLIEKYIVTTKNKPKDVHQLLDFASKCYVNNQINIVQYRSLSEELVARGAEKPVYLDVEEPAIEI